MLPFACKDVASDPPTTVIIVDPQSMIQCSTGDTVFAISEENVEVTEGWLHREGKPNMTICFMHSFGKCSGRVGGDPSTCYQVHIKRDVLATLRAQYVHLPRHFFARIVHAQLTDELRNIISKAAKKEFKMQYLDYKVHDIAVTSGLQRYEAVYRRWLFSPTAKREGAVDDNLVFQCENYALHGCCPNEEDCTGIHATLCKAQVRDHAVARALDKLTSGPQLTSSVQSSSVSISTSPFTSQQARNLSCSDSNNGAFPSAANSSTGIHSTQVGHVSPP